MEKRVRIRETLLLSLLGLIILALLVLFAQPTELKSQLDLPNFEDNQKVLVSGQIIDEKIYSNSRTLLLTNNITLYCLCKNVPPLKGKKISSIGLLDTYQKTKINVLEIKW
jgi:hypothetical protein